jgi:hypothetical protein
MNSGNLRVGGMVEDSVKAMIFPTDQFDDVTSGLIKLINQTRKTSGNILVVKKIGNYIQKYHGNLYESDYQVKSEKKKEFLKPPAFVRFEKDYHLYKILSRNNDEIVVEYNTYNYQGRLVTVNKKVDITKGPKIKSIYLMFHSSNLEALKVIDAAHVKEEKKMSNAQLVSRIIDKFKTLYDIDVKTTTKLPEGFKKNIRAWITAESGKNSITINLQKDENIQELMHEYLHLFLAGAKYSETNRKLYETLLTNFLQEKKKPTTNIN